MSYSFNALYSVEVDSITSCKSDNCFEFVSRFTVNGIWNPQVSTRFTSSLTRDVKYAEHSWIGHARALYGRLCYSCKKVLKFHQGCLTWVSHFNLSILAWFLKSDDPRLECSMNYLLSRARHSTSCTYEETHPTFTFLQSNTS